MPAVWFMAGMTPHGLFHPMANSSIFHGKRLRWLSKTVSPWNTGPSDQQSRNLLPGKCGFSRPNPPARIPPPVPRSMLREGDWMSGFLDLPLPNECDNTKDQETDWRYKPPTFPLMCRMPQIAENNGREDKQIWQGTFTPTGRTTPLHQLDCNNHDPKKHPVQQQN